MAKKVLTCEDVARFAKDEKEGAAEYAAFEGLEDLTTTEERHFHRFQRKATEMNCDLDLDV